MYIVYCNFNYHQEKASNDRRTLRRTLSTDRHGRALGETGGVRVGLSHADLRGITVVTVVAVVTTNK